MTDSPDLRNRSTSSRLASTNSLTQLEPEEARLYAQYVRLKAAKPMLARWLMKWNEYFLDKHIGKLSAAYASMSVLLDALLDL